MNLATLADPKEIVFAEVDKPTPKDNEVLIKVKHVGVCGSDIHACYGKHPYISCPVVKGHEFAGAYEFIEENPSQTLKVLIDME